MPPPLLSEGVHSPVEKDSPRLAMKVQDFETLFTTQLLNAARFLQHQLRLIRRTMTCLYLKVNGISILYKHIKAQLLKTLLSHKLLKELGVWSTKSSSLSNKEMSLNWLIKELTSNVLKNLPSKLKLVTFQLSENAIWLFLQEKTILDKHFWEKLRKDLCRL